MEKGIFSLTPEATEALAGVAELEKSPHLHTYYTQIGRSKKEIPATGINVPLFFFLLLPLLLPTAISAAAV